MQAGVSSPAIKSTGLALLSFATLIRFDSPHLSATLVASVSILDHYLWNACVQEAPFVI
jgi:hypothetical protein